MHNAVVSVWVRFGLKERAASKQLFRSSGQPQLNHQGHISSSQVSIRAGSFPLLSVHVICGERTQAPHTHTHSTPNSGFFLLRGDCEPPRCPNGVCLFIPLALWVWLHVGWRSEVKSGRFWKRARESDRHRGEEAESWSWQFHSDHLNVQTISALIREPRRCMCVCRWLPFTPESIHTLSCILAQLTRGMVRWSSQNTTWQQLPWEGWVSLLTLPTHTPSFSSCAKIQIHNLLDTSPPQLNPRLSDCLQLGLNLQVNCDQH